MSYGSTSPIPTRTDVREKFSGDHVSRYPNTETIHRHKVFRFILELKFTLVIHEDRTLHFKLELVPFGQIVTFWGLEVSLVLS